MMTKGEGGQKSQKIDDVIYERPLTSITEHKWTFYPILRKFTHKRNLIKNFFCVSVSDL